MCSPEKKQLIEGNLDTIQMLELETNVKEKA